MNTFCNLHKNFIYISIAIFCFISSAEVKTYSLKGKVMDSDDNWLNDVRIFSKPLGIATQTDPNGNFSFNFSFSKELKPNKKGVLAFLIFQKEGHNDRRVPIKSMDFFSREKALTIKLQTKKIDPAITGYTTEMKHSKPLVGNRKGTTVEFHVYIPESVKKVKAAFYISRHGMGTLESPVLRKFAEEEQVALVGMLGDPVQRGVADVSLIDEHIKKLAGMSGHPELPNVPVMTFGHSNGTGFAASWPRDRPDRTIAWVSFHPGFSDYLQFQNTEKVPCMVMLGTVDKYLINSRQDKVVAKMRSSRNAAMCSMMEGGVGHGPVNSEKVWTFITKFLKSTMYTRLLDDGTLKPVNIENGWLGEIYNFEKGGQQLLNIGPFNKFKGEKSSANWFPDKAFAEAWQVYGNTKQKK